MRRAATAHTWDAAPPMAAIEGSGLQPAPVEGCGAPARPPCSTPGVMIRTGLLLAGPQPRPRPRSSARLEPSRSASRAALLASVVAYRLTAPDPDAPPPVRLVAAGPVRRLDPFQACDGCEAAFCPQPDRCRRLPDREVHGCPRPSERPRPVRVDPLRRPAAPAGCRRGSVLWAVFCWPKSTPTVVERWCPVYRARFLAAAVPSPLAAALPTALSRAARGQDDVVFNLSRNPVARNSTQSSVGNDRCCLILEVSDVPSTAAAPYTASYRSFRQRPFDSRIQRGALRRSRVPRLTQPTMSNSACRRVRAAGRVWSV